MRRIVLGGTMAAILTTAVLANAKFSVKSTNETCKNAHAILVASTSGQHDLFWRAINRIIAEGQESKPARWTEVDDYPEGVVRHLSKRQYQLKYVPGGHAYVVHCGHGGTCNSFARAFLSKYDKWYSPEVFCGPIPSTLINGFKPDN